MKRVESSQDRPEPQLTYEANGLWLEFDFSPDYLRAMSPARGGESVTEREGMASVKSSVKTEDMILAMVQGKSAISIPEMAATLGVTGPDVETVYLIDWEHPEKNDFALAEEVTLKGATSAGWTSFSTSTASQSR